MKTLRIALFSLLAAVCLLSSCSKEKTVASNVLVGEWKASSVDFGGVTTDIELILKDSVQTQADGACLLLGNPVGTMAITANGEQIMRADVPYCLFNANTLTGEMFLIYEGDTQDDAVSVSLYYTPKRDSFTAIAPHFNITFTRKK